jgi:uncharacterized membrane protein
MKRTASSVSTRLHAAGAESIGGETARSFRANGSTRALARRGLLALPVVLALVVPAAPALAQSSTGTSGYKQTVPVTTTPKSGTAPSKESTTPATTTPKASTEPATTTAPAKAASPSQSTLPFTGLDLRWVLGAGLLLLACGLSIRLAQRRQRHGSGR